LRAIIFDMDGVLTDTIEYHYLSWKRLAQEYGLPFTRKENDKLLGLTRRRSLEVLLKGRSLPDDQIQQMLKLKNIYYMEYVKTMTPADLLPGVSELLEEAQRGGLKIGVASASRNTHPVLTRLGIAGYVQAVVDGNSIRRSKPNPEVFLKTAQALEQEPHQCLVLEDSRAGVEAAHAAGMCAVGLGPVERLGKAEAVFPGLEGVRLADLEQIHRRWLEKGLRGLEAQASREGKRNV
jgi:beta-phosphoglucomutase